MTILLMLLIARFLLRFPSLTKQYLNHSVGLILCPHPLGSHLINLLLYLRFRSLLDLLLITGPSTRVSLLRIDLPFHGPC